MSLGVNVRHILAAIFAVGVLGGSTLAGSASGEGCMQRDEALRARELYALRLPDCRAYEQVSPVDKNNADALGRAGVGQSSPSGEMVTFFSLVPFPGISGSSEYPTYLSTRGSEGWLTQGLLPPTDPGATTEVVGLTEDLSSAIIEDDPNEPTLSPGAEPGLRNYYIRSSLNGAFKLLAIGPTTAEFEDEKLHLADATSDDSSILFEEDVQLDSSGKVEAFTPGVPHLYEWDDGQVTQVGVLQDGSTPLGGAVAGPGGPAISEEGLGEPGGAGKQFYTPNTLSGDGSRVFFTGVENGQIYVREDGTTTVQVSASHREPSEGEGPAYWRAATPDGRYVFFTSESRLTNNAKAERRRPDLYRFDVESGELADLTVGGLEGAGVLGTLGVSEDGATVYFVAREVLAGVNAEGNSPEEDAANLYEWHDGDTTFIARLERGQDRANWSSFATGGETGPEGEKSSRVTASGGIVLFTSVEPLAEGFNNSGNTEVYRYDEAEKKLKCISCNPLASTAGFNAYLVDSRTIASPNQLGTFLTRNLSTNGDRVFFETEEGLTPQDTNGQMDVYEWESEGEGSCAPGNRSCIYLISSGLSPGRSYLGDASANGDDVFFFTRQALVSQDRDENVDVYDARVDGGIGAQNPPASLGPCMTGEECHGAPSVPPALSPPSSATLQAEGELAAAPLVVHKNRKPAKKKSKPKKMKVKKTRRKVKNTRRKAKMGTFAKRGTFENGGTFERRRGKSMERRKPSSAHDRWRQEDE